MAIELIKHNPEWGDLFKREAKKIKAALGETCYAVCHIGSTAVRSLHARPIIDIMAVVDSFASLEEHHKKLIDLGYQLLGEETTAICHTYAKRDGIACKLVIFEKSNELDIARRIAFRNYLSARHEVAAQYDVLRRTLAEECSDVRSYYEKRNVFIEENEKRALAWQKRQDRQFNHLLTGIVFCVGVGSLLGMALSDFSTGMCIGVCIGAVVGIGMSMFDKNREG